MGLYVRQYFVSFQVAEVRLFGEEEIEQDVYITVSEWPDDQSRIIIHGYCSSKFVSTIMQFLTHL